MYVRDRRLLRHPWKGTSHIRRVDMARERVPTGRRQGPEEDLARGVEGERQVARERWREREQEGRG